VFVASRENAEPARAEPAGRLVASAGARLMWVGPSTAPGGITRWMPFASRWVSRSGAASALAKIGGGGPPRPPEDSLSRDSEGLGSDARAKLKISSAAVPAAGVGVAASAAMVPAGRLVDAAAGPAA